MKKIFILFLFSLIFNIYSINASSTYIFTVASNNLIKLNASNGSTIFSIPTGQITVEGVITDPLGFVYTASRDGTVKKWTDGGSLVWTNTSHTSLVRAVDADSNGFIYTTGNDNTVRKIDSNGNQVWSANTLNAGLDVVVDINGNVYVGTEGTNVIKYDSSGNQQWIFSNHTNIVHGIDVDDNGNVYTSSFDNTARKVDANGNQVWSNTSASNWTWHIQQDNDGNLWVASQDGNLRKLDSSGNTILTISIGHAVYRVRIDDSNNVFVTTLLGVRRYDIAGNLIWNVSISGPFGLGIELPPAIQYPLEINLDSNYDSFADIVYESDFLTTTSSIVNDILPSASEVEVSTNQSNISPFVFQHWFDLDNNNIFTTSRTFTITNPDRDYNLRAIYDLTNSIDLSLNSNLPTPPDFNVEVDTIEEQRVTISKYPFINEEIPFGYNFEVEAPDVSQISFYEFDYWWNNTNNTVFTTSAIISLDAIENYDLTATYSLPNEYQIALTLFSNIGDITFQLGNQPEITGSFIQVTVGAMDSWTASGPLNSDWQFQNWTDLETNQIFSTNRFIGISNTSKNYILEALYFPIYDVNWNSLGGTPIAPQRIVSGGTINAPSPDPIRPNFAFDGWALPSAPSTPITFPQFATTNVTYQAIWLNTFTLTFNENGGQQVPNQIIIENNTPTVVTPSRFGYTFDGWFTDNLTFNNLFDFNAPFTQNTTIHAKWIFGTDRDAGTSFDNFLTDAGLNDAFSKWIIVLVAFIVLNVIIFIYKGPFIVTTVLNFILTALFIVLGFIPIWIIIIIFIALFGFGILMFTGGRS